MLRLSRRTALSGAAMAIPMFARDAHALQPVEAATLLGVTDAEQFVKRMSDHLAVEPWGKAADRLWAACVTDEDRQVTAAVILTDDDGGKPRIVAGPVDAEVLSVNPFWSLNVRIALPEPLGPGIPAFGVTISNGYLSTGRSTGSDSLSIFLRDGATLRQVFRGYLEANSSEVVECRTKRRDDAPPCRMGWSREWEIKTEHAPIGGKPPPLVVVAKPSRRVVSRHVWRGDRYHPDRFDPRMP